MWDKSKSKGENRVRISFNVTGDKVVDEIKLKSAELINLIESLQLPADFPEPGEFMRLKAQAQTEIESGAAWAVKAATAHL